MLDLRRLAGSALAHSDPLVWQTALRRIARTSADGQLVAAPANSARVLIITRGLPASGKTGKASRWVAEAPTQRARVNCDSLRAMMHGRRLGTRNRRTWSPSPSTTSIRELLAAGLDVVADTNLAAEAVDAFRQIAAEAGAQFEIWDLTATVSLEECLRRDARRTGADQVGEAAIRRLYRHRQHLAPGGALVRGCERPSRLPVLRLSNSRPLGTLRGDAREPRPRPTRSAPADQHPTNSKQWVFGG
ncbi:AAA family ATPase [Actinoplanes sp. NPDC051343]|uniref:AAA family ATPase n=1 Tax=Actinoplanes sp. NPDC051343 TaxID=3363906 RepID=UPI0037B959EF